MPENPKILIEVVVNFRQKNLPIRWYKQNKNLSISQCIFVRIVISNYVQMHF
jgi:hypothetical protein